MEICYSTTGLSNTASVIYFPGALIYSAGFNVNQNFKKDYFWITVCFNFFRSTPMNTVFPLLQSCFLLYPFYCPLPHPFLFHWRKCRLLKSSLQTNNASEPTLLWGTGHYYCRGVINLSSFNSPSRALSCLQIKIISSELQNISGNTVIKNKICYFY
jgi:hypothetical protein